MACMGNCWSHSSVEGEISYMEASPLALDGLNYCMSYLDVSKCDTL